MLGHRKIHDLSKNSEWNPEPAPASPCRRVVAQWQVTFHSVKGFVDHEFLVTWVELGNSSWVALSPQGAVLHRQLISDRSGFSGLASSVGQPSGPCDFLSSSFLCQQQKRSPW